MEKPYLEITKIVVEKKYNPHFGDNRKCTVVTSTVDILIPTRICTLVAVNIVGAVNL